jgi:transposase
VKLKRIGVDLAKSVFQVHGVDSHEQVKVRKQLKRREVLDFFRQVEPCVVAMEACGSAHYWGRELTTLGHDIKLIAPQFVKPYVKSGKNDANDAEAICEAASRPTMRYVALKTPEQQAGQALHRVRSRLVRARTALVNEIRGLLSEFGIVGVTKGVSACRRLLAEVLEDAENGVPDTLRELLAQLSEELKEQDARLATLDRSIKRQCAQDERIKRLLPIEGIGPISASAIVAAVGDARQFKSGRDLAAWLGLVPNQHSSGGKERLSSISKRGDAYLRTLLIHGARAVVNTCTNKTDRKSEWIKALMSRRNKNIATVALANKNARILWAVLTRGEPYQAAKPKRGRHAGGDNVLATSCLKEYSTTIAQ